VAKVWVLDTETKGTGANMVPLERVLRKPGSDAVPGFAFRKRKPAPQPPREHQPLEFKLVDVMTREVLARGVDARSAVRALERVRSIVDVTAYAREAGTDRWRMLSFADTKALWKHRRGPDS
jgi:hypothetical protein